MKKSNHEQVSDFILQVQKLKDELEFLQERSSKIKLELFFDTENQDLIDELEKIKKRNIEINEQIKSLNNQILSFLHDKKDE